MQLGEIILAVLNIWNWNHAYTRMHACARKRTRAHTHTHTHAHTHAHTHTHTHPHPHTPHSRSLPEKRRNTDRTDEKGRGQTSFPQYTETVQNAQSSTRTSQAGKGKDSQHWADTGPKAKTQFSPHRKSSRSPACSLWTEIQPRTNG